MPCKICSKNWPHSGSIFDIPGKTRRLNELDRNLSDPDLWSDPERARKVNQEAGSIRRVTDIYGRLHSDASGLSEMLSVADDSERELLAEEQASLEQQVDDLYRETLFTMQHADAAAIVRV